jgi:DNA replication and repair protein RecF
LLCCIPASLPDGTFYSEAMFVSRLSLQDFRSYRDAAIEAGDGLVILTGENGAGKTNVLEAVSLLAPGRGLRGATLGEMARAGGGGGFAVAGDLAPSSLTPSPQRGEGGGGGERAFSERSMPEDHLGLSTPSPNPLPQGERASTTTIGTGTLASAPERRQVRVNGAQASASALAEWLSVLWLTPAMDRLFIEARAGRRRFLDRLTLALVPDHAVHSTRYEAAMRARNKLLGDERPDRDWLSALEGRMAEHGTAIAAARREMVEALSLRIKAEPETAFARAHLALGGWTGDGELAAELASGRARDIAAGRSLAGPHRTDLLVRHAGKDQPAERCSTGEQKALLLGIVLAHADLVAERRGARPILLLDEVAAHLDPLRRSALLGRLADRGGQVWMTGTEVAPFADVGAGGTWLTVTGGDVRQEGWEAAQT